MVFNTGGLISVKVVPDRSPLEVSFTQKFTENVTGGGRARCYWMQCACPTRASFKWCEGSKLPYFSMCVADAWHAPCHVC